MPILPLINNGDKMTALEIVDTDDYVIIKVNKQHLSEIKGINPEREVNEVKQLIDGRESVIKRSMLQVYFDEYLLDEIRHRLAELLVYYSLEGKRYDRRTQSNAE